MLSYNIQNFNQVLKDMNNENINIPEEDFNEGLEDIEQMLKPQCEFKACEASTQGQPMALGGCCLCGRICDVVVHTTRGEESRRSAPCPSGQCLSHKASAHGI